METKRIRKYSKNRKQELSAIDETIKAATLASKLLEQLATQMRIQESMCS